MRETKMKWIDKHVESTVWCRYIDLDYLDALIQNYTLKKLEVQRVQELWSNHQPSRAPLP